MNTLLLLMGGSGTRMGAAVPKQFLEVDKKPVYYYIVEQYAKLTEIGAICIVCPKEWLQSVKTAVEAIAFSGNLIVAEGGATRSHSVRNGLKAIESFSADGDVILLHDATHPYCDEPAIRKVIETVHRGGGATVGACQYDTCYQIDAENTLKNVIPRQEIVSGASPESFQYGDLKRIYFKATDEELVGMTSAGALALAHNIPMKVIPTKVLNLKLTYPEDFALFQLLYNNYFFPRR